MIGVLSQYLRTWVTLSLRSTRAQPLEVIVLQQILTVQTSAIRARLDCSTVDWPGNLSLWLTVENGSSLWYPEYTDMKNLTGVDKHFRTEPLVHDGNLSTRLTAQVDLVQCCANLTENEPYNPAVIAYWTENWRIPYAGYDREGGYGRDDVTTGNFTVKWIRGPATFAPSLEDSRIDLLYFSEPPEIQALNCMPTFELSQAEVTVEPKTGVVQQYRILDIPFREDVAWSDYFLSRPPSGYGRSGPDKSWMNTTKYYYDVDVTTR
jgi:hypothetical protein